MLTEVFLNLTAETSPALRRLGLVGDAVALWSRATRRARDWAPHEARSRAFVERALADVPERRTALVLGSGLLRDVPVALLAARFARVVLLDAVHLWPARRRAGRWRCERQVVDLTGVTAGGADALAVLKADPQVDFVVSACVLSQLPHAPGRKLHDGLDDLPARLVRRHLDDLAGFAGRVCLVTDVSFATVRPDGAVDARHDLLGGVGLPDPDEAWDWTVAPFGEIERRRAFVHRVHAYADLRWRPPPLCHDGAGKAA